MTDFLQKIDNIIVWPVRIAMVALFLYLLTGHEQAAPQPRVTTGPSVIKVQPPLEVQLPVEKPTVHSHFVWATVTAYDAPCEICCPHCTGLTSTGLKVSEHPYGIAADPKLLPYGTRVRIPGFSDGFLKVDDTGGAMRQAAKRGELLLDLRMPSHETARAWGRRSFWVEVLDP